VGAWAAAPAPEVATGTAHAAAATLARPHLGVCVGGGGDRVRAGVSTDRMPLYVRARAALPESPAAAPSATPPPSSSSSLPSSSRVHPRFCCASSSSAAAPSSAARSGTPASSGLSAAAAAAAPAPPPPPGPPSPGPPPPSPSTSIRATPQTLVFWREPSRFAVGVPVCVTDGVAVAMALWVDKYRPTTLNGLDFHPDVTEQLRKLVGAPPVRDGWWGSSSGGLHVSGGMQAASGDFPHMVVYGPSGSGANTLRHTGAVPHAWRDGSSDGWRREGGDRQEDAHRGGPAGAVRRPRRAGEPRGLPRTPWPWQH
jgi:hypothetical protein